MRVTLFFALAAAQAPDYSSYQKRYSASSGGNMTHEASGSQYAGSSGDWEKYAGAHSNYSKYEGGAGASANWSKYAGAAGDWKKYLDWHKYSNGSDTNQSDTYAGPFKSDESILKLKGNVTALKAKEKEVKHMMEQVKKFVPTNDQDAPLGQFKKDLSDIKHLLKEAEAAKQENATKTESTNETKPAVADDRTRHATSGAQKNATSSDEAVAKGTAFLARTDLLTVIDAKVDDLEDKIKTVKRREGDIKKYVPEEYQAQALNSSKMELKTLEAELKAAKFKEVKEKKMEEEKEMEAKEKEEEAKAKEEEKEKKKDESGNATSSKPDSMVDASTTDASDRAEADAGAALLASERPTRTYWGGVSLCFCATVSVLSLVAVLRRRTVNVDPQPLLG